MSALRCAHTNLEVKIYEVHRDGPFNMQSEGQSFFQELEKK